MFLTGFPSGFPCAESTVATETVNRSHAEPLVIMQPAVPPAVLAAVQPNSLIGVAAGGQVAQAIRAGSP